MKGIFFLEILCFVLMNGDSHHNKSIQGLFFILFESHFFPINMTLMGFATKVSISTIWGVERIQLFITLNAGWYFKYSLWFLSAVVCVWPITRQVFSKRSFLLCLCSSPTDLSVMVRQVNAVLCSEVGSYSTTHCCLHDQSVPPTGELLLCYQPQMRVYWRGKGCPVFLWRCRNTIVIWRLFIFRLEKSLAR